MCRHKRREIDKIIEKLRCTIPSDVDITDLLHIGEKWNSALLRKSCGLNMVSVRDVYHVPHLGACIISFGVPGRSQHLGRPVAYRPETAKDWDKTEVSLSQGIVHHTDMMFDLGNAPGIFGSTMCLILSTNRWRFAISTSVIKTCSFLRQKTTSRSLEKHGPFKWRSFKINHK